MDGTDRTVIHNTGLIQPNGLTLDHSAQVLYWIDANYERIESSFVNGTNRMIILSTNLSHSFGITLLGDTLYYTKHWSIRSVQKTGSTYQTIKELCKNVLGIEVIAEERQPSGVVIMVMVHENTRINKGIVGFMYIILLSSMNINYKSGPFLEG